MAGGWKKRGKSNRPKAPPDGHRSDSTGIVYQFPSQRSSDSGFVTLRLSRPPALRSAKIFSHPRRCPLHTQRPPPLAAFCFLGSGRLNDKKAAGRNIS